MENAKKTFVVFGNATISVSICVLMLITSMSTATTNSIKMNKQVNPDVNSLSKTFLFNEPTFSSIQVAGYNYTKVNMQGCFTIGKQIGALSLPVKFIQLLLPPQKIVNSVTVTGSPVELKFSYNSLNIVMDQEIYYSHELYPAQPYGEYNIGYSHGYAILNMVLKPVQLIPAEGRLFYYPTMTVTINLRENKYQNPFFRNNAEDVAWVKNLVNNPEVAEQYICESTFEYPGGLCDPSEHYDYVIITTEVNSLDYWDTTQETPYNWESLMNKHMNDGLSCTLVTVQAIDSCADYQNSSPLFNDQQAHIREFCKDAYEDWGTKYILIGGDGEANFIPARDMDTAYEQDIDSDIYWSNLDNTFNADLDNYWGEEGDSGFDLYTELYIGRLTCDRPQDVSNWLTKSFFYADSIDIDYLENGGFYAGNMSEWPGATEGDDLIDFAAIKGTDNWFGPDPGYNGPWPEWLGYLFGFETWNTIHPDSAFNLSVRWTKSNPNPGWQQGNAIQEFRNALNNNSITLVTGIGHANEDMSLDVYSNDWESTYHNTMPFFIIDLGSHCGDMDAIDDGVLESMLFYSNTSLAFGCMYNTGYTWTGSMYDTNSSVALQTKLFWDYFFDLENNSQGVENWQFGKGLAWSKDALAPTLNWDYTWRSVIDSALLFADPAQLLRPPEISTNNPPDTPIIYGPTSGKPGVEYTYCINLSDPDNDSLYVLWNWGDGNFSGWLGPYSSGEEICNTHSWNKKGTYTISVTIRDIYGDVVTASIEVTIPRNRAPFNTQYSILFWLFERFPIIKYLLRI